MLSNEAMDSFATDNGDVVGVAVKDLKDIEPQAIGTELSAFQQAYRVLGKTREQAKRSAKRDVSWTAFKGRPVEDIRRDLWDEIGRVNTWRENRRRRARPPVTPYLDRLQSCCASYGASRSAALQWVQTYYVRNRQCHGDAPSIEGFLGNVTERIDPHEAVDWAKFNTAFEDKKQINVTKRTNGKLSDSDLEMLNSALECRRRRLIDSNGAPTEEGKMLVERASRERERRRKAGSRPPKSYGQLRVSDVKRLADIPSRAEFQALNAPRGR
ncbi:hypothetical protein B0I35DRAFT_438140 [Stachybotrys elegans]|uniref:Uncharacterized protein n=1 Tax=Stachybotrys elegans TaxID=80388 RepID=A0A8K0WNJ7_9HYPO|nr:hypothetical protein B0I35DRAFT_438140 [Stachybotrys elegans]